MSDNINPYNEIEFKSTFEKTKIYKKLKQDFGDNNLIWLKFFNLRANKIKIDGVTPRQQSRQQFSASVFYYLLPLLEKKYDTIYDLGCGANMFKPYLPGLIGIGAERALYLTSYNNIKDPEWPDCKSIVDLIDLPDWIKEECVQQHGVTIPDKSSIDSINKTFFGDIDGFVNDSYIHAHQAHFQAVFSICALHFHSLTLFKKVVLDFSSMIKPGGRGFLALNLQRMIEFTPEQFLIQRFSTSCPTAFQFDQYLREELSTLDLKFLILDIDLTLIDEGIDGNIRLVIEK
jgi:hypothetical protein